MRLGPTVLIVHHSSLLATRPHVGAELYRTLIARFAPRHTYAQLVQVRISSRDLPKE